MDCSIPGFPVLHQLLELVFFFFFFFSSVQSLSHVQLFATPWIAAHQASLSITNFRSLLKPVSVESVIPSSHLILCRPLLLLPPNPPSIRAFSNDSTLRRRWAKVLGVSASASVLPMNTQDWSPFRWTGCKIFSKYLCHFISPPVIYKNFRLFFFWFISFTTSRHMLYMLYMGLFLNSLSLFFFFFPVDLVGFFDTSTTLSWLLRHVITLEIR